MVSACMLHNFTKINKVMKAYTLNLEFSDYTEVKRKFERTWVIIHNYTYRVPKFQTPVTGLRLLSPLFEKLIS